MKETNTKSVFETLNAIDVSKYTEKKGNLTYLSWAWAWGKVKENYPDAFYTIYENSSGWNYHTDGRTCWVKTGVTINGLEHIEYLPVMDNRNNSIASEKVTSFDVNKAIQRGLTKAAARHGLGLYIYAGEDLPEPVVIAKEQAMLKDALTKVESSANREELITVWNDYGDLHLNIDFKEAVALRGKELNNKPKETKKNESKTQQQPSLL